MKTAPIIDIVFEQAAETRLRSVTSGRSAMARISRSSWVLRET
jgi:hypothetical protein